MDDVANMIDCQKGNTAPRPTAAGLSKFALLVASEKGGVGKSVVSWTLGDYLRAHGHRVGVYDGDGGVGTTLRLLGKRDAGGSLVENQEAASGVGYYSGRADDERAMLLDSIESGEDRYLHDTPGGFLTDLMKIVDDGEGLDGLLSAFESRGYRVVVLHVIAPDQGATASVNKWLELTGARATHVAVVNRHHGKPPGDFPFWCGFEQGGQRKGGKTRERLLEGGGLEVTFPALPPGTFAKLDSENVPFSKAADAGLLTITERAHVARFLAEFAASFAPVFKLLGVDK